MVRAEQVVPAPPAEVVVVDPPAANAQRPHHARREHAPDGQRGRFGQIAQGPVHSH
jgi:hypothetical protein